MKLHIVRTTNKDMRMILELLWRIQEEKMKFAPMNYHYLRYSAEEIPGQVEQSVFNSIDLYCSAPQFNIFDYSLFSLLELEKEIRRRDLSVMGNDTGELYIPG